MDRNNETIRLAKKAADAWRTTDTYHQAAQIIDMLISALEGDTTLTPPNEWRGVEEGLPEIYLDEEGNNIPFLVCGPDSKYPFRALFIGNSWFNRWDPVEVTHWMPLPAPPNRRPSEVAP